MVNLRHYIPRNIFAKNIIEDTIIEHLVRRYDKSKSDSEVLGIWSKNKPPHFNHPILLGIFRIGYIRRFRASASHTTLNRRGIPLEDRT